MTRQRTEEWFAERLGNLTASRWSDAMATTKSGWGMSRYRYISQLAMERISGQRAEHYQSDAMIRGSQMEEEAVEVYELLYDADTRPIGYVPHPTIPKAGASPDRLVGDDGLIEFKCPDTHTHLSYIMKAQDEGAVPAIIPGEYIGQMNWQMICTGRVWCDWVSYDDRVPVNLRMLRVRLYLDPETVSQFEDAARQFLAEVDKMVERLNGYSPT